MPLTRLAAVIVAALAAIALGIALGTERWGGLVPCALCLLERWPYRAAILLGLIGAALPARAGRVALWLVVPAMLAGAALGAVHVGVEQGAWTSPLPECAAPRFVSGTVAERLAAMPSRPSKPCDDPTYLIPGVPVSMAALNLLFALALGGGVAIFLTRKQP